MTHILELPDAPIYSDNHLLPHGVWIATWLQITGSIASVAWAPLCHDGTDY